MLGLLDRSEQWAATTTIGEGAFRTAVEAPTDGQYRIVIANNLHDGQRVNSVQITEVGLVGFDPAEQRRKRESPFGEEVEGLDPGFPDGRVRH